MGYRDCHTTAKCNQHDDIDLMMGEYEWADDAGTLINGGQK